MSIFSGIANAAKKVGSFAANELLGVDDFGRVVSKASKGDFAGAAKSDEDKEAKRQSMIFWAKNNPNKGTNAGRAIREEKAKKAPTPPKPKKATAPKKSKKK